MAHNAGDPGSIPSWVGKFSWRRDRLPTPAFLGFLRSSDGKESSCSGGDLALIPGLRRSPGGGHDNPLRYSCLENPHGQRSLAGYSPRGHKELDTTEWLSTAHHSYLGFPGGSGSKESACNARDPDSIPGLRRSPGGGHDNPLQYSCLENPHGQRSLAV